jgi:hypothetical protein
MQVPPRGIFVGASDESKSSEIESDDSTHQKSS